MRARWDIWAPLWCFGWQRMTFHETDIDLTSGTPSWEQRGINSPGLFCSELQTTRPKVFFQGMARCEHLTKVTFLMNEGKDLQQWTWRSCISLLPCSALILIFVVCSNKHCVKIEVAGGARIRWSEMRVTTLVPGAMERYKLSSFRFS